MVKHLIWFEAHCCRMPDADGLSFKALIDGLVAAGIIPDDDQENMLYPELSFVKCKRKEERVRIRVAQVVDGPSSTDIDEGLGVRRRTTSVAYTVRLECLYPAPVPTWNRLLAMDHRQRKTARALIHQLTWLACQHDFKQGPPSHFDWAPGASCPWRGRRRAWNHFIERYYISALARKTLPETKLWRGEGVN